MPKQVGFENRTGLVALHRQETHGLEQLRGLGPGAEPGMRLAVAGEPEEEAENGEPEESGSPSKTWGWDS